MKNKFTFVAILAITFVFAMMFVSAAAVSVTVNAPANYSNHTGSFTYNCTASAHNVLNITVYANSSSGTMNALQTFTNTSAGQTAWTGTVTITSSDDGANQNISCYADNGTGQAYSSETGSRDVMLDSTDPSCSIDDIAHPTIAWKGIQSITHSSSDAIELVSTIVTVDGPQSQSTITLTDPTSPIGLASNDTDYIGTWTVTTTATDRAGNTCTDSETFKSYLPGDKRTQESGDSNNNSGRTLLILGLVALGLYMAFGKKK